MNLRLVLLTTLILSHQSLRAAEWTGKSESAAVFYSDNYFVQQDADATQPAYSAHYYSVTDPNTGEIYATSADDLPKHINNRPQVIVTPSDVAADRYGQEWANMYYRASEVIDPADVK